MKKTLPPEPLVPEIRSTRNRSRRWPGLAPWAALLAVLAPSVARPQAASPDVLLGRLEGAWLMQGTIGGRPVTHDVVVERVLDHYLQLREVSREKDAAGRPEYQAIVYLEWQPAAGEYACLWLDSTGGGGLDGGAIGRARPNGDEIRLRFAAPDGSFFHTTFAYQGHDDTWRLSMDTESGGQRQPFARTTLERN